VNPRHRHHTGHPPPRGHPVGPQVRPVRVDPGTGYRHYAPEQLGQARLVAWPRRLGMPLARIRALRDLATCLVGRLSTPPTPAPRKDTAMLELPGRRHAR